MRKQQGVDAQAAPLYFLAYVSHLGKQASSRELGCCGNSRCGQEAGQCKRPIPSWFSVAIDYSQMQNPYLPPKAGSNTGGTLLPLTGTGPFVLQCVTGIRTWALI